MHDNQDGLPDLRGKVLYIEDQEINQVLMEAQLADQPGIVLIKAITGAEGVRLVRSEKPDLVLLDMHLPDFGGLEVVRELMIEISNGLKVALLTADTLSMDIIKAMSLGAYEYWIKPVDRAHLLAGLRRALTAPEPRGDASARDLGRRGSGPA
ncbi:response regulator [Rhizobacter sp. LjRoot28]|jgi:two-component system, cell cycle response regulator DivK|uniref:response regulator n=1 Tax=Rhizobacter sp. LjRoot28 TaxID=3342309 RepID=UPI003ECD8124